MQPLHPKDVCVKGNTGMVQVHSLDEAGCCTALSPGCSMLMLCRQLVHRVVSVYGKGAMVYVVSIFRAPFQGKQRRENTTTFGVNLLRSQVLYRAAQGYLFNLGHCHKNFTSEQASSAAVARLALSVL